MMQFGAIFCFFSFAVLGKAKAASISLRVRLKDQGRFTDLSGASVRCYDEDYLNADDVMTGTVQTGGDGRATLTYQKIDGPSFFDPFSGWDIATGNSHRPDIYCIVTKSGPYYKRYTVTKDNQNQDVTANFGYVTMYPDRVRRGDPGTANGCGPASDWDGINGVVDFLTGFGDMCDNHDLCYNNCYETKNTCDDEFRDMMYSKCDDSQDSNPLKATCKAAADGMYSLVRGSLGLERYNAGQVMFGCCPTDPNKAVPGQCGCGNPDTDSDNDGTADCNDACKNDPNKVAPGACGCGVSDNDDDSDGILNCNDNCPTIPNPGQLDTDLDGEGDACDLDDDGDGTPDSEDECPLDPNKSVAGACGCGTADGDDDSDGIENCIDNCPTIPNPGQLDTDLDGEGDACDLDDDGDGTPDSEDECPLDPNKSVAGACGCGVEDEDADGNSVADCLEEAQCGRLFPRSCLK